MARPETSTAAGDLLERDDQLAALSGLADDVRRSARGRVVLVSGEAGVGKTALLRRFCGDWCRTERALWGGCDPLFTPRPLGPLLAVAEGAGGELADAVSGDVKPHELVGSLVRELRSRAPTVFVLEDVHWADEATLDVLKLLARGVEAAPALVVATYRDDELDRRHPLRIMLGELATKDTVARLRLVGLSPAAVARLAEPVGVDADELYRKTAGNPFFVVEALAAHSAEIPETVKDAVFARTARLGPDARSILEAVAILPLRAEFWLLEAMAPDALGALDECLTSGMLASAADGVVFRHELARLAVEESIALDRRVELHRKALAALADPPGRAPDLARLAHHAEAAGDVDAVLRYAPEAALRASALGAHREAVAQYARALRFGGGLPADERADLLERRARECLITDQYDEGIADLEQAVDCRRSLDDPVKEGDDLRRLSEFLWCPGRTPEAERSGRDAVALLESLPAGPELAAAYGNLAHVSSAAARPNEAVLWGSRAVALAVATGDIETELHAAGIVSLSQDDFETLEQILERALRAGLDDIAARTYTFLAGSAVRARRYVAAERYVDDGIAYCSELGIELFRLYLLAFRARLELGRGAWTAAAETAAGVLGVPRTSTTPRIHALVVLALVRARRGDPEVLPLLDEARALADPTGELPRFGPVAAARAEVAWLEGRHDEIAATTGAALELAAVTDEPWLAGELAYWRRRAGVHDRALPRLAKPYALELAGDAVAAARLWTELGCPYESALALAGSDDDDSLLRAVAELNSLGAKPAAAILTRRLRERGTRNVPRGPRAATRDNPAGLTTRELEVLTLVAEGLRNADIAGRLFVSEKTVDHHVSAVLRKLEVRTRGQAAAEAARLGILAEAR